MLSKRPQLLRKPPLRTAVLRLKLPPSLLALPLTLGLPRRMSSRPQAMLLLMLWSTLAAVLQTQARLLLLLRYLLVPLRLMLR